MEKSMSDSKTESCKCPRPSFSSWLVCLHWSIVGEEMVDEFDELIKKPLTEKQAKDKIGRLNVMRRWGGREVFRGRKR